MVLFIAFDNNGDMVVGEQKIWAKPCPRNGFVMLELHPPPGEVCCEVLLGDGLNPVKKGHISIY
jgi:hypothetical protein